MGDEVAIYMIIGGLVLFSLLHLVTATRDLRTAIVGRLGELQYKGLFSFVSLVAFGMAVYGYTQGSYVEYWAAGSVLILLQSFVLMPVAIILLVSSYVTKGTQRLTRHPMLMGVTIVCFSHVLVNGDLIFILFFGGLGIYAVLAMIWSDHQRRISKDPQDKLFLAQTGYLPSLKRLHQSNEDVLPRLGALGLVIGAVSYGLAITYHGQLLGVSPLSSLLAS
ncbi:NnrU family protein [Kiloniella majae]|uniref:NnrU family protein n=1 Tax=Kiloniella majae TaxID=1938558 RepID=UPI000A2776F9|nr:NnrU family protein [Kiloniella majae]